MKDDLLTVAEYAEAEGITKQAVYSRMRSEKWKSEHCVKIDNKLFVDLKTFEQKFEQINSKKENRFQHLSLELELAKQEVKILRELVTQKDKQINSLIEGWTLAQRENAILSHKILLLENQVVNVEKTEESPEDTDLEQSDDGSTESPEPETRERWSIFDRLFKRK